MYEKQPHLNGAYYGPAVPPPQKSYHLPGRGVCGCCCGCIFNLFFKLILTIIIVVGIVVFLFWLIVRPNVVKVHVTDATLTQFNYTTNNSTLYYNLSLNITIRNPNKRLGIYYDHIEAQPFYHHGRFDSRILEPFYQGHKSTKELNTVFKGQHVIVLDADQTKELDKDKGSGVYEIEVKLYLKLRFKLGAFKTRKMKPKVECNLHVPLTGTSPAGGGFQRTKCDWDY